jgi:fumarylacetoacetase
MKAIIPIQPDSDFSIHNLPFGIFKLKSENVNSFRVGMALGTWVIDLIQLVKAGLLTAEQETILAPSLNLLASRGRKAWLKIRTDVQVLYTAEGTSRHEEALKAALKPLSDIELRLPFETRGFTDFYASRNHATHVGELYRSKENALNPNWLHIPIAYNGRANTLFPSGQPIKRPSGQILEDGKPVFQPCRKLDFELELGTLIGSSNNYFESVPLSQASEKIFGHVLVNDWSARDIQAWEYVPLGPFLGKSFATSVSPWVVVDAALDPFRVSMPAEEIAPLEYLHAQKRSMPLIQLEVALIPRGATQEFVICRTTTKELYWSFEQMIAHHASNGTKLDIGDLLGSGTISGEGPGELGCLLEATKNGKEALKLTDGVQRTFLENGDTIIMRGYCEKDGIRVGFGELKSSIYG